MVVLLATLCGLLGLVIGSFLNVVIHRLPRKESVVSPPSACPACGRRVRVRDNVPVLSWLVLRGRCRDCGAPISLRYPLVELGTGALFAVFGVRFGLSAVLPAFLYLAAVGIALAAIDLDVRRLPNALTLPSYGVGLVLLGLGAAVEASGGPLLRALLGCAAMYGVYLLLALVYPAGMGWGDVKLAGVLGLYLGYLGWGAWTVGLFLGFVFGGVFGLGLIVLRRGGRKTALPFGPFMLLGALVAVLVGLQMSAAYLSGTGISS